MRESTSTTSTPPRAAALPTADGRSATPTPPTAAAAPTDAGVRGVAAVVRRVAAGCSEPLATGGRGCGVCGAVVEVVGV